MFAGCGRYSEGAARFAVTRLPSEHSPPLFDHHPDMREVKPVDGNVRLRELIELVRAAFDAAALLMPYRRLMWAAFLARVPIMGCHRLSLV